jgi:hypothetical protein
MLSRGGALNPDGLALDLQFAADKTLTARKGPTPTFTRASTATFVGSNGLIQTAAINAPRFDHDPVTGDCRGLLIEESRTNALQHSANFKNTTSSNYWENLSATTVTVDQITSPDGGLNADLLSTSATAFDCFFRRANFWAGSTQYTYSVFLKQGPSNHRYVGLYIGAGVGALKFPFFDFDNPTVVRIPSGVLVGAINSTRVDAYPNGWYRVIVTFTTAATPASLYCGAYISTSDGVIPASSVAGLDVYVWGLQSELGAFPTSYIPTTTASVVRSADVCSITGSDFSGFYNQSEGSFACNYSIPAGFTGNRYAASIEDAVGGTQNGFVFRNTNRASSFIAGGGYDSTIGAATTTVDKHILAYSGLSEFVYVKNSVVGTTTGSGTRNPSLTIRMSIGSLEGFSSFTLCGHIASIRYYRKRLPNAKLQSLTA